MSEHNLRGYSFRRQIDLEPEFQSLPSTTPPSHMIPRVVFSWPVRKSQIPEGVNRLLCKTGNVATFKRLCVTYRGGVIYRRSFVFVFWHDWRRGRRIWADEGQVLVFQTRTDVRLSLKEMLIDQVMTC